MPSELRSGRGGARSRSGRKHRDTVIIYARVAPKTADAIRKRAASENATLGEILEKHLKL